MPDTVRISYEPAMADDPSPHVVIHNPKVLSLALLSQLKRFGMVASRDGLSGKLNGSRKAFTEVIETYGVHVEVVPSYPGNTTP